jgi:ferredoxin-NADP reductase
MKSLPTRRSAVGWAAAASDTLPSMRASFVRSQWEDKFQQIATFYFRPHGSYRYEAGQYALLSVPHDDADSRGISRTMTLSSSPQEPEIAFTMRIMHEGGSSFKRALLALSPGNEIAVQDSLGDLVLPLDQHVPLVFVAGGVAIASYIGMMKWLLQRGEARDISVLYAVRSPDDVIFRDILQQYAAKGNMKLTIFAGIGRSPRRLTHRDILACSSADSLVYLSGTETMVDSLRHQLKSAGVDPGRIIYDFFDGYDEI